jgi:PAS domain S-box-containing protein
VDDGPAAHEPDHRADRRLQIAGRTWTLRCRSRPGFETRTASIQPWIVALGGLAVSGLLFAVQLSLVGRRKVALARAEQMTAASRAAHERFDLAVRGSNTGIWDWDIPNGVVWFSPRWKAIVGHADDEIRHAYGEWESRLHPDDMPRTLAALEAYLGGRTPDYEVEFRMRHKDGTYRWILARGIALRDASGKPYRMAGSHLDITQQKQQWAELQASLAEKETLLREVHHRVKNNMQVISSLLRLQAQTFEGGRSHDLFADCQDRIHTMALVHEKLYRSGNLAAIDFGDYARDLASILRQAHGLDAGQVQIGVQADTVLLNIDTSVPLGLVLCELVTNALKHAFPEGRRGTIEIAIRGEPDGGCCLCVTDDGVGMPEHLAAGQGTSLGLRLVHMLVRQIDATFEHRKSPTTFTIRFAGRRTVAG